MRLGDEQESVNFEDRTGERGGFGFGGGGVGGGGMFGLLFGLVLSRFGIGGVLILALGYCALSSLGGGGGPAGYSAGSEPAAQSGQSTLDPATRELVLRVLGSTERRWRELFTASGESYQPTTLVFYAGTNRSGCGVAQAAMGPFYCPSDGKIYLDTSFFDELQGRFGAAGDFAQAYVIAHEVGHHVQSIKGTLQRVRQQQARVSSTEANALQVGVELQADCYAGVWAANDRNLMEPGDLEEGLRAARAIGDDTLQRQIQGRVVPEAFTHGSAAQRIAALKRGLETADPAACEAFTA